ncbi:MAG: ATP-dependent metallopeptidase FtsH/Yme1/Tma family protein [Thermodesulfobacteriota bacterium]
MEKKTQFSIGYFLLVFFGLLLLQNYFFMRHVQDILYSEFRKLVKEKKVDDLVISANIIRGKMRKGAVEIIATMRGDASFKEQFGKMKEEGHRLSPVRMEDADLVKVLEPNGIQYTA